MKTRSSKAARLEDVARLAKVSTATVSRALTLPHKVKARTLERVQQAASTLGYVAHGAARALALCTATLKREHPRNVIDKLRDIPRASAARPSAASHSRSDAHTVAVTAPMPPSSCATSARM